MANRSIEDLARLVAEFPGIGPRQARRIVQFLLSKNAAYREDLAQSITAAAASARQCAQCFRFDDLSTNGLCHICADQSRENALMVVEKDVDIEGVEVSGAYHGRYFVLGGLMSMTKKNTRLRDVELMARVAQNNIEDVLPFHDSRGRLYRAQTGKTISQKSPDIKTTFLGKSICSVGAEIEYADSETLRSALKNRA